MGKSTVWEKQSFMVSIILVVQAVYTFQKFNYIHLKSHSASLEAQNHWTKTNLT